MQKLKTVSRPTIQNPAKLTNNKIKSITGYAPEVLTDPNGLEVKVTPTMMFVPDEAITDQLTPKDGCKFTPNAVNRLIDRSVNNDKYYIFDYDKEDIHLLNACLNSGGRTNNEYIFAKLNDGGLTIGDKEDLFLGEVCMELEEGVIEVQPPDKPMTINVWRWVKTGIGKGYVSWNGTDRPMVVLEGPGFNVIFTCVWGDK